MPYITTTPSDQRPDRDRCIAVAIGDLDRYGARIPTETFLHAANSIALAARRHGGTVYALTTGEGIGSDGANNGATESSAVILCGNVRDVPAFRRDVADVLRLLNSSSAAFIYDGAHEPVFDTPDGRRP